MKKVLCLSFAMLFCMLSIPAFAEPASNASDDAMIIMRADDFFSTYALSLNQHGGGSFMITFSVSANQTSHTVGITWYTVEQWVNDSWTPVASGLAGSLGYDTFTHSFQRVYSGTSGCKYRVYANFFCRKYDGTSKNVGMYSGSITVQ